MLVVTGLASEEALISWGWRIPFFASVLLIAVGIYIRLNIEGTPRLQQVREHCAKAKLPFAHLMRHCWKAVILGGVATLSTGSTFTLLLFGRLSDQLGRRPIIAAGIAAEAVLAFPFFWLINTGSAAAVFLAYRPREAVSTKWSRPMPAWPHLSSVNRSTGSKPTSSGRRNRHGRRWASRSGTFRSRSNAWQSSTRARHEEHTR